MTKSKLVAIAFSCGVPGTLPFSVKADEFVATETRRMVVLPPLPVLRRALGGAGTPGLEACPGSGRSDDMVVSGVDKVK